jgi:hypothetical protein
MKHLRRLYIGFAAFWKVWVFWACFWGMMQLPYKIQLPIFVTTVLVFLIDTLYWLGCLVEREKASLRVFRTSEKFRPIPPNLTALCEVHLLRGGQGGIVESPGSTTEKKP